MKSLLLMIAVVAAACAASFLVFYMIADRPDVRRAATEGNSMEWLRAEFRLDESQFEAIKRAHRDFSAVCAGHCRDIMEARSTPGAGTEVARLEAVCVDAMIGHFREVAALMPSGEGERYLAIVLPRIEGYDHARSPTIGVRH